MGLPDHLYDQPYYDGGDDPSVSNDPSGSSSNHYKAQTELRVAYSKIANTTRSMLVKDGAYLKAFEQRLLVLTNQGEAEAWPLHFMNQLEEISMLVSSINMILDEEITAISVDSLKLSRYLNKLRKELKMI
ncbi:MAG: hypothetical protein AAF927_12945 [Bacteroidota bacterium]